MGQKATPCRPKVECASPYPCFVVGGSDADPRDLQKQRGRCQSCALKPQGSHFHAARMFREPNRTQERWWGGDRAPAVWGMSLLPRPPGDRSLYLGFGSGRASDFRYFSWPRVSRKLYQLPPGRTGPTKTSQKMAPWSQNARSHTGKQI